MSDELKDRYLPWILRGFGLFLICGVYPLMNWLWISGWAWHPRQSQYEQMIQGIYATLGVFLFLAARAPAANRSLIQFSIWSSIVHAGIMTAQAGYCNGEQGHLLGDVPALLAMAAVLWIFLPGRTKQFS